MTSLANSDTLHKRHADTVYHVYHGLPADTLTMTVIDDGFEALLEPFYNGKRLTDPISTKEDKYQLLPAFLKVKGVFVLYPYCVFSVHLDVSLS